MVLVELRDVLKAQEHSVFALCKNEELMSGWCTPFQLCTGCGECRGDLDDD